MDPRYKLIGTAGRFTGSEFAIGPGIHQVGRHSSNQVILGGDGSVSRNHARLTVTSAGVTVEDLRSTNGTLVNGKKVTRSPVKVGDRLQFGDAVFVLSPAAATPVSMAMLSCPVSDCTGVISAAGACSQCGQRPLICPRCQALNTADARFCRADGVRLSPTAVPHVSAVSAATGPNGLRPSPFNGKDALSDDRTTSLPAPPGQQGGPARSPVPPAAARATVSAGASRAAGPPAGSRSEPAGASSAGVSLTSEVLRQPEYPRCPICDANVGAQADLCPRCRALVRRCASGHVSPGNAAECVRCKAALLPVPERWGVFRGASSTGWTPEAIRPPLKLSWKFRPPEGPVKWTSPVTGSGVTYASASDSFVYAIQQGIALWRTPLDGPVRTDFVPETCVPAYSDGKVYVGHMGGSLTAIQAADGAVSWQFELGGRPSSPPRPARGFVYVGVAVTPEEGAVCAIAPDGTLAWRFKTESPVYSCPAFTGGKLVITTSTGSVIALDAADGSMLWQHTEQSDEFATAAAVSRESVYATSHDGKLLCLALQTGEVLRRWLSPTGAFLHSSPALGSGRSDGTVVFGSDDSTIYVVGTEMARTISSHPTRGAILGSPALSDDLAFIGSQDGNLYVIGPEPHRIEVAYKMADGLHIASSPAAGDGQIVFAGSDGCLYALEPCPLSPGR